MAGRDARVEFFSVMFLWRMVKEGGGGIQFLLPGASKICVPAPLLLLASKIAYGQNRVHAKGVALCKRTCFCLLSTFQAPSMTPSLLRTLLRTLVPTEILTRRLPRALA